MELSCAGRKAEAGEGLWDPRVSKQGTGEVRAGCQEDEADGCGGDGAGEAGRCETRRVGACVHVPRAA